MPKLKPDTQRQRREHILDAALKCFAEGGFHATSMQRICKEAKISAGALYLYFASKEDLIAGLCERDRAEFAERFARLSEAEDFLDALKALGQHYFVHENSARSRFALEMGIEATRNPRIASIFFSVDQYCRDSFEGLFTRLKADGRINPAVDVKTLAKIFNVVGDGMFWRRAIYPDFDAPNVLPVVVEMVGALLNPTLQTNDEAELVGTDKKAQILSTRRATESSKIA